MKKGSLTVFLSLIMVAVMTLLFTMSEFIRLVSIESLAGEYTDMAVESAFSEYNPYLWTNYRILAIDLGYGTDNIGPGILETKTAGYCEVNSNVEEGNNYGRLGVASCQATKYALLTDGNGQAIVTLGAKAAEYGMAAQLIDGVQSEMNKMDELEKVSTADVASSGKNDLENEKAAQAERKRRAAEDNDPNTDPNAIEDPGSVEDDPFDAFFTLKEGVSKGVLSMVVSADGISDYSFDIDELPSHRDLNVGTMDVDAGGNVVDKALFTDYLMTNYSYYGNDLKHEGMKYELEYLIAGRSSDTQNLARVVEEIMAIREVANYSTISKSEYLSGEALGVATILAMFTGSYEFVEVIHKAIMASWAYAESILDLRTILSGGKVPIIKDDSQWTSDVKNLSRITDLNVKAKESESGMGYKEYLIGFLVLNSGETLGMRAIDVMENALSQTEDYKDVKLDNMIYAADISIDFTADEMFLSLLNKDINNSGYFISKRRFMSY